jgi:Mn2+/Fe2+ NRAMP family transporter
MVGAIFLNVIDWITPHMHTITGLDAEEHRHNHSLNRVLLFVLAIAIHKLPEGMAAGVSVTSDTTSPWAVTLGIALHNIPEGMVIIAPLLMAGISSTVTSGMAAGSIFAGIFGESYHIKDIHSKVGVILSLGIALMIIFFIDNPFYGLIISQMILSMQLPFTVFLQVALTSSKQVMGKYANSTWTKWLLYGIATVVSVLNVMLLFS